MRVERSRDVRIFLTPSEAVAALRAKGRLVGGLTYGWTTPDHPDVSGMVLAAVRRFLRSELGRHVVAVFWDFASLPQKPRSSDEDALFQQALGVMGDVYASPLGTTVMRHKAIPPCPAELAGEVVVLGGPAADDELAGALGAFGEVQSVRREKERVRARLASHVAAEAAAERGVAGADAVFPFFNARAYDGRGWCTFESGVATEALARAAFYPKLQAVLARLPAKLVEIDGDAPVAVSDVLGAGDEGAGPRIERVRAAITAATFTGKGDKETVQGLYSDYITKVSNAFAGSGEGVDGEYEGEYNAAGQEEGHGTKKYASGATYVGTWSNGKKHGQVSAVQSAREPECASER